MEGKPRRLRQLPSRALRFIGRMLLFVLDWLFGGPPDPPGMSNSRRLPNGFTRPWL